MEKQTKKQTERERGKNKSKSGSNECVIIDQKCKEVVLIIDSFSQENVDAYTTFLGIIASQVPTLEKIGACIALSEEEKKAKKKGLISTISLSDLQRLSRQRGGLIIKTKK